VKTGPAEAALDAINPPNKAAASKVPFRNSVILFPAVPITHSLTKCACPLLLNVKQTLCQMGSQKICREILVELFGQELTVKISDTLIRKGKERQHARREIRFGS